MHVKISSIAAENVAALFRQVTSALEDALSPAFLEKFYGGDVEQFSVFAVAVDSDKAINARFCLGYDKAGRYRHPLTRLTICYISFALPFNPESVVAMTYEKVYRQLCISLLARLAEPSIKMPKGFDFDSFAADLRIALEIQLRAA
jgi:hypothetical protein